MLPATRDARHDRGYGWFAAGVGSWFGAFGMQGVLFSWILVGELDAEAKWVGIAQTMTMLPSLFLLLVGGATADRFDPRRLLIGVHALAPIPVLALAVAAQRDVLSIPLVLGFAISMGTLTAFGNPARDALLARVAGDDLMGAVSGMTAVQFGSQAVGSMAAGTARLLGTPAVLAVHASILLSGLFFARRVPRRGPTPPAVPMARGESRSPDASVGLVGALRGMREGLAVIARSPELRGCLLAVFAVGVFFIGPFGVVLPLMVRDFYQGDVDQLAFAFTLFPLGTISGSLVLRRIGLRRKGRAMLLALATAATLQIGLGSELPFWGFALATFGWGLAGAIFINASRTIFQEHAPAAFRGRILAAYQLGFTGGGPIGAFGSGFTISTVGLGETFMISASAMGVLLVGMSLFSRVPQID